MIPIVKFLTTILSTTACVQLVLPLVRLQAMEKDIVTIDTRNTFIAVRTIKLDIKEG